MGALTTKQRRETMRRVKSENTKPEMAIRRLVHRMGYRYRLHRKDLPGKPDMVFPGKKKIIFIHGCFWHGHNCRAGRNKPRTNTDYWIPKIEKNVKRDKKNFEKLKECGWDVMVVWECEIHDLKMTGEKIKDFLSR